MLVCTRDEPRLAWCCVWLQMLFATIPPTPDEVHGLSGGVEYWINEASPRAQARNILLTLVASGAGGSTWTPMENALFLLCLYGYSSLLPSHHQRLQLLLRTLLNISKSPWVFSQHMWTWNIAVPRSTDLALCREVWLDWLSGCDVPMADMLPSRTFAWKAFIEPLELSSTAEVDGAALVDALNKSFGTPGKHVSLHQAMQCVDLPVDVPPFGSVFEVTYPALSCHEKLAFHLMGAPVLPTNIVELLHVRALGTPTASLLFPR